MQFVNIRLRAAGYSEQCGAAASGRGGEGLGNKGGMRSVSPRAGTPPWHTRLPRHTLCPYSKAYQKLPIHTLCPYPYHMERSGNSLLKIVLRLSPMLLAHFPSVISLLQSLVACNPTVSVISGNE